MLLRTALTCGPLSLEWAARVRYRRARPVKPEDPYTLTRATHCEYCKGPLTIEYRPGSAPRGAARFWVCPHAICGASNLSDVMGEVIDIWPGHVQKPR
jgi:hypothetical protein